MNALLFTGVGVVAVALIVAATSREPGRPNSLANATRPHLTGGSVVPRIPTTVDVRAASASGPATPITDQATTTSTVAPAPAPTVPVPTGVPPTTSPAPVTTVADPGVVITEVPVDPFPTTTVLPVPTTTQFAPPTTAPHPTGPPSIGPPSTSPPTSAPTTTVAPLLPLPPLIAGR